MACASLVTRRKSECVRQDTESKEGRVWRKRRSSSFSMYSMSLARKQSTKIIPSNSQREDDVRRQRSMRCKTTYSVSSSSELWLSLVITLYPLAPSTHPTPIRWRSACTSVDGVCSRRSAGSVMHASSAVRHI